MANVRYKILFLASWYPSRLHPVSGIFIKKQVESLVGLCDMAVLFVSPDSDNSARKVSVESIVDKGVTTIRVFYPRINVGTKWMKFILNWISYIRAGYSGMKEIRNCFGKPDLIHVNVVSPAGVLALLLRLFKNIPYVLTEHSDYSIRRLNGVIRGGNSSLRIKSFIARNAECIIVDSNAVKAAMQRIGFRNYYIVVPNVADIENCYVQKTKKPDNGLIDKKLLVHISLLWDEMKNISGIIRAIYRLIEEYDRRDFEFHIIGDGPCKEKLEELANELGLLNNYIIFHGYVDDEEKEQFLNLADCHILNSNFEGFSVVTAEAIAHGTPVIATRCGGPEDFVTEEVGILIAPNSEEELMEAILYMLDNSSKYKSEDLIEYARKRFSSCVIGEMLFRIYREVLTSWHVGNSNEYAYIHPDWNVLDIGSGHHPNRRANVLLEKVIGKTQHRKYKELIVPSDKELVIGDATSMPFEDKEFDYAIASHIAEHIGYPARFCEEVMRVAQRGYIETPGPLGEMLFHEKVHKWIVTKSKDRLIFKTNKRDKPLIPVFYRIFHLNEEGTYLRPYHSKSPTLILVVRIIRRIWKAMPFAYTKFHWEGEFKYSVDSPFQG